MYTKKTKLKSYLLDWKHTIFIFLDNLFLIFSVIEIKADDLKKAADMEFKDYEPINESVKKDTLLS